ncbi:nitrate reductase associated protein [Desertifilum sp. FACHB-1129]|uniref:Nitrate reductase associated protein n=3 Tax=Cyanophyceae TaxID=3028117 RepID=A0A1E5QLF5_9CYAN|nr:MULTISPECIES: nitrate reductase associated protein [Desertifilum]MCD8487376.1 nitrate reductase associated protein [Desertifilum sp.]MDA0208731.1 nitrate reductase associated protein [Cyanobacteria bacterium FC1]MDL5044783.1 nitrate reductase associated protein [Oscillatoria amoena NRMC-F 0135]MBD2310933.1 nitrate reductase associated protein [Desertifilum sp. FACHB-1129]MBD2321338.1 nitrate reductase associated protein [Desertifilum sp. FACHB-866]
MSQFFQFEADFVESLRCIPMQVRLKLDTCGIKLKLNQWHQFNPTERQALVDQPCESPEEILAYRKFLQNLVQERTGQPASELPIETHPAWLNATEIPQQVQEKTQELNREMTLKAWENLTPVQRFALIKLSRPSHENHNFLPALQEFNLA